VGPTYRGEYCASAKTLAVSRTSERPTDQRRNEVLGMLDPKYYSGPRLSSAAAIRKDCNELALGEVAGRRARHFSCTNPEIHPGQPPGPRVQIWLDRATGMVLRMTSGAFIQVVQRMVLRPAFPASTFAVSAPRGTKVRWAGTGAPPPQYAVRNTQVDATVTLGGTPRDVAADGSSIWVADAGRPGEGETERPLDGGVLRIDARTGKVVARLPLPPQVFIWPGQGDQPSASAQRIVAAEGAAWVLDAAGYLYRVDSGTNTLGKPLLMAEVAPDANGYPFQPGPIAAGGGAVWVARIDSREFDYNGTKVGGARGSLLRLDPLTGDRLADIPLPGGPNDIAFAGGRLWVVAHEVNPTDTRGDELTALYTVDPATNRVDRRLVVQGTQMCCGGSLFADDHGIWLYTPDMDNTLVRVDPATGQVVARLDVPDGVSDVVSGPDGALWAANGGGTTISRIDLATNKVDKTLGTGNNPVGIAVAGRSLWVIDGKDATASRVDL
jgi:DNA-binding beta-propeller fold protein YncE